VAASYIQNVAEWVGTIAEAKEEDWEYELPRLTGGIATVAVSLDGAMIPMADSEGCLGVTEVLLALRPIGEPFLPNLPSPLGFHPRSTPGGGRGRARQHAVGPDPPRRTA
jgi:hypothetical protein